MMKSLFVGAALLILGCEAFVPAGVSSSSRPSTQVHGFFDKVGEFFEELDAFVDDATARRLGNGSKFYGKRRSNFYGENDKDRKVDRKVADPTGTTRVLQAFGTSEMKTRGTSALTFSFLLVLFHRGLSRPHLEWLLQVDAR